MPEIDLNDERKPRVPAMPTISRRGCAQLFGQLLVMVAVLVAAAIVGLR